LRLKQYLLSIVSKKKENSYVVYKYLPCFKEKKSNQMAYRKHIFLYFYIICLFFMLFMYVCIV